MLSQGPPNSNQNEHLIERSLQKAVSPLGSGWDMEIIEAVSDNYHVDFRDASEQSISEIENALRDMLGSAGDLLIERFYSELRNSGYPL